MPILRLSRINWHFAFMLLLPFRSMAIANVAIVRQTTRNSQLSNWEALQLERYFGADSKYLWFKEILAALMWAARQRLIEPVGTR